MITKDQTTIVFALSGVLLIYFIAYLQERRLFKEIIAECIVAFLFVIPSILVLSKHRAIEDILSPYVAFFVALLVLIFRELIFAAFSKRFPNRQSIFICIIISYFTEIYFVLAQIGK
jgi:hypothetical protein